MAIKSRGSIRRRSGALDTSFGAFVATGSGAASNPTVSGILIAATPGMLAAGSGVVSAESGGAQPVPGLQDYWGLSPTRFISASASGSDNGQSESAPWTWAQYLSSATSGMVVGVMPGVYTRTASGARDTPTFNAIAETTLVCKRAAAYNETNRSEFRHSSGGRGPTIGMSYSRDDVKWIGAYVNEINSPVLSGNDCGLATQWGADDGEFHGCLLVNDPSNTAGSNLSGIRVEQATGHVARNCVFRDCRKGDTGDQNYGAWLAYDTRNATVEHCEFYDNDVDWFPKGDHGAGVGYPPLVEHTFRFNKSEGSRVYALHIIGLNERSGVYTPSSVYKNLIIGARCGIFFHSGFSVGVPRNIVVDNNTFDGNGGSGDYHGVYWYGWVGVPDVSGYIEKHNNLYTNNSRVFDFAQQGTTEIAARISAGAVSDDNHSYNNTNYANIAGVGNQTLAQFRSTTSGLGGEWESDTTTGDPLYVDRAGGNYRLQSGGPAAGKGCYVTGDEVIGLER